METISVSLFNKDNLELLESNMFKNVNEVLKNEYVSGFIEKYENEILLSAFNEDNKLTLFLKELKLFCNENQFIKYLNITFDRKVKLFYRNARKKIDITYISLNQNLKNELELLDLIPDEDNDEIELFYDETLLSKADKEFIDLFNEENKKITEKEVAVKLNITQQAVCSRLKRVRKRYIKSLNNKYRK